MEHGIVTTSELYFKSNRNLPQIYAWTHNYDYYDISNVENIDVASDMLINSFWYVLTKEDVTSKINFNADLSTVSAGSHFLVYNSIDSINNIEFISNGTTIVSNLTDPVTILKPGQIADVTKLSNNSWFINIQNYSGFKPTKIVELNGYNNFQVMEPLKEDTCFVIDASAGETQFGFSPHDPPIPVGTKFSVINRINSISDTIFIGLGEVIASSADSTILHPGEKAEVVKISTNTWYVDKAPTPEKVKPFTFLNFAFPDPEVETTLTIDASIDKKFKFDLNGDAYLDFPTGLQNGDEIMLLFRRTSDTYWMNFDSRYRFDIDYGGFQFHFDVQTYHLITAVYESNAGILMCRVSRYLPPGYGY